MSKLSFVSLVSYDYEYLIKSISSYYDIADEIILGLDENLISWSNLPINIDKNKVKNDILAMDCDGKIKIIEGNFHSQGEPMKNDTYERNFLSKLCKDDNWIVSVDADEAIPNSEEFKKLVENSDSNFQLVCTWINLFKKISDDKYVKINTDESFFVATKLKGQYVKCRETTQSIKQLPIKILHYSWCRSEDELYTKLKNWSHSQDFDTDKWLAIWKSIDEYNYMHFYNIHPLYPTFWPSLSLININERFSVKPKYPKTSIIIGTYNHCEDLLKPCCEALVEYTNLEDKEIIIVSNGSKDNTKEYVESLGKPFKLLWFNDPLGYSKANNEGIKVAIGDYIILLNNDAFLLPQEKDTWINMLLEPFRDEKVGITSPIKGHNVASNELFMMFFCVMIKKEIIEKIGLLDESFKSGCEDVDFSIRVKNSGYDIVQVPVTKDSILWRDNNFIGGFPVHHLGQRTIKEMPEFYETQIANNELLVKKHSKIYGFMHIALMGNWKEIVSEQLDLIKKSGLFNNSKIFACIVGDHQNESLDLLDGIEILQKDNNIELFEFITLKQLIKFCKTNVDSKIWYIHTKGVARPDFCNQENHWRQYMQYFVIEKWQQCVEALNSHDACGAEWFYAKFPDSKESSHFSGNFWWANSNYINTLDEIETSDRFDAERFIGSGHPKVKCFHNSYENLYHCNYTRDRYIS